MPEDEAIQQSDPLGVRAIKLKLISREDLEVALQTQNMTQLKGDCLGDVLLDLGFVDHSQYHEIITHLITQPAPADLGDEDPFCALAREKSYVTEEQTEAARKAVVTRARRRRRLGQILLDLGVLTQEQLATVLATYDSSNG